MTKKYRSLLLIGTAVIGIGLFVPTKVGDGRLPRWTNIAWDLSQAARRIGNLGHQVIASLASHRPLPDAGPLPRRLAARPAGSLDERPAAAPVFGTLNSMQTTAVVDQAYANAVAIERLKALGFDPTNIRETIAAYRAGDLVGGDALAHSVNDRIARTALEWVALRQVSGKIDMERLSAFDTAHSGWPTTGWFRHQMEARLFRSQDMAKVEAFFRSSAPVTSVGKLAFARALKADGHAPEATALARALYRDSDLPAWLEGKLKADFGGDLQKSDYKYKADRLLYKEDVGPALRIAALAGPEELALAKARAAVIADSPSDKAIAAVPASLRNDPGFLLAIIQKLRRADKLKEAASAMLAAPRDPAALINGDEWWVERRVLARKILDSGDAKTAYRICAEHSAVSPESRIEAEFHAGWIALRFLNDPTTAAKHFATAATLAATPTSIARVAYWQGRTMDNSTDPDALLRAKAFYEKAAHYPSTYYGQLARATIGLKSDVVRAPTTEATGAERADAVRVDELLFAAGDKDDARALAIEAAQGFDDESQMAALAHVIDRQQDAHLSLTVGKLMERRGFASDSLAFPTFGIPRFDPLANSASSSVVYSVARQESAFNPMVVSAAGAKGLMQMIDATARRTAMRAGLAFDDARLLTDAAFNAQLGAAHLGALLAEQGGSYILTFAAYNAGGGNVKKWIEAYGDPRNPGVDPIDWVERIPFTETRNYVERVVANVTVYQARFASEAARADGLAGAEAAQAKL